MSTSYQERSPKALVLLVLALLGGSLIVRPRQESESKQVPSGRQKDGHSFHQSGESVSGDEGAVERRLKMPLANFLGVPLDDKPDDERLAALRSACEHNGVTLEFLIVCVPDPIDAVLGYRFDTVVDSLQRAFTADHYVPDRYYLPWQTAGGTPGESQANGGLPRSRAAAEPGVLLFRRPPNKESGWQQLLVVYLVGETSIYGIHKEAFRRSVSEIKSLRALPRRRGVDAKEFRVLGPCFSGSAASLKVAIGGHSDNRKRFRIISGMTNNLDPSQLPVIDFKTTTVHVDLLKRRLLDYVDEIHVRTARVAWLTESDTGFGNPQLQGRDVSPHGNLEVAEFTFPINISRVRSVYEQEQASQAAQRARLVGEKRQIPLVFEDLATSDETLPQFSPDMTAVVVDRTLDQILSKIRRDRYRYVGITASDVRDKLFLADKLSETCPDARLLLVGADVLFTHESKEAQLEGAIVASSYPLHANNQFWSFPFQGGQRQMAFPSHSEHGIFNAAILLRHPELTQQGSAADDEAARLIEYGTPLDVTENHRPCIWLSIIGRNALLPINARSIKSMPPEVSSYPSYAIPLASGITKLDCDRSLNLSYEAADYLCLLAVAGGGILLAGLRFSRTERWAGKFMNARNHQARRAERGIHLLCSSIALVSVWAVATHVAAVAEQPLFPNVVFQAANAQGDWGGLFSWDHLWACLPCLLTVLGATALVASAERRARAIQLSTSKSSGVTPPVVACLAAASFSVLGCPCWLKGSTAESWLSYFFIYLLFFVAHVASCWLCAAFFEQIWTQLASQSAESSDMQFAPSLRSRLAIAAVAAVAQSILAGCLYSGETWWRGGQVFDGVCWFERTAHLFRGGSLLFPSALVACSVLILALSSLKRLYLYSQRVQWPGKSTPTPPQFQEEGDRWDKAAARIQRVAAWPLDQNGSTEGCGGLVLIAVVALVYLAFLMWRTSPTPEGWIPSVVFWTTFAAIFVVWAFWLWTTVVLWQSQRALHKALAELPLADAFRRLPDGVSEAIKRFFWTRSKHDWIDGLLRAWRKQLQEHYKQLDSVLGASWVHLQLNDDAESGPGADPNHEAAGNLWPALLAEWQAREVHQRFPRLGEIGPDAGALKEQTHRVANARDTWIELAEEFMALYFVPYVSQFLRHWWNLVASLMTVSFLLLIAVASYPFEPQQLFIGTCVTMIALVGLTTVYVEVQMEWDPLLSRMMGTRPNRIDWNSEFVVGLLAWIVPVALVLFAHVFPGAWTWFGGALQNFSRTMG